MADRTSARIFGDILRLLAKNPIENKAISSNIWGMIDDYDFNPSQMDEDEALIKLGLATETDSSIIYKSTL